MVLTQSSDMVLTLTSFLFFHVFNVLIVFFKFLRRFYMYGTNCDVLFIFSHFFSVFKVLKNFSDAFCRHDTSETAAVLSPFYAFPRVFNVFQYFFNYIFPTFLTSMILTVTAAVLSRLKRFPHVFTF